MAYLRSLSVLDKVREKVRGDEKMGVEVIAKALQTPTRQIAANAGFDGPSVVEEVRSKKGSVGFDAAKGEYRDMFEAGIIDPTKVTKAALQNASSLAGLVLTTETLVTQIKEKEEEEKPVEGAVR